MSTPPSSHAPVEQRHRELLMNLVGYEWASENPPAFEHDAQLLADAEAESTKELRDFRDRVMAQGGVVQATEGLTRLEHIEQTKALQFQLSSLQEQLTSKDAEIERLKKNIGCARNQGTTQFCAEARALQEKLVRATEDSARIEWLDAESVSGIIDHGENKWMIKFGHDEAHLREGIDRAMAARAPVGQKEGA